MKPVVSICIPTYNGARYLEACLNSALNQTYKDIEILVIDDRSTDSTIEILERYVAIDQRIKLIENQQNLGLVGNWLKCIELSTGLWIKFLFQDDLLEPNCVTQLIAAGEAADCPIVFCKRELIYETNSNVEVLNFLRGLPSWESVFGKTTFITPNIVCETALHFLALNIFGEPTSVLLRRDCFSRFGLFNPHFRQLCDYEYWIRVGSHTGIALVPETLASFRLHSASTTSSNHARKQDVTELGDHLLLLHDYAYAESYTALRLVASNQTPPFNFVDKLSQYINWACKTLYEKERQGLVDSQTILTKILANLSAYPLLVSLIRSKNRILPIFMWLDRHLLWRFR